jgi:ribosomal protein L31
MGDSITSQTHPFQQGEKIMPSRFNRRYGMRLQTKQKQEQKND